MAHTSRRNASSSLIRQQLLIRMPLLLLLLQLFGSLMAAATITPAAAEMKQEDSRSHQRQLRMRPTNDGNSDSNGKKNDNTSKKATPKVPSRNLRQTSSSVSSTNECQEADTLLLGGTLVTMAKGDDENDIKIIEDGGIAILDTKIAYVGTRASTMDAYCINRNSTNSNTTTSANIVYVNEHDIVMPGLINDHGHAPMTLLRGIASDDLPLHEWLDEFILPAEANTVDPEFVQIGSTLAALEMIQTGTTTYVDMYYYAEEQAKVIDQIGLRGIISNAIIDFPAPDAASPEQALAQTRRFMEDWAGHPLITATVGPHSPYLLSKPYLEQSAALAREFNVPLHIHVSETQHEVDQIKSRTDGLTPFEYLDSIDGFFSADHHVIAAHAVVLTEHDIEIIARTGAGLIHNPESNMKLASGVKPLTKLLEASTSLRTPSTSSQQHQVQHNIKVGLGTDGASSNDDLDMFEAINITPLLQKVMNGDTTTFTGQTALEMATIRGAEAIGMGDKIGSLEVGKEADIIILDGNSPHMVPRYDVISSIVYAAKGSDVKMTMVAGRVLYEGGSSFTTLDPFTPDEILDAAREQAGRIRATLALNVNERG